MGFIRELFALRKAAAEVSTTFDPAAQMRAASAQMQQASKQAQIASNGTAARATVTGVRDTGTELNLQPITEVQVLLFPVGRPPIPSTVSLVGHAALAGVVVGATLDVRYDHNDPRTCVFV